MKLNKNKEIGITLILMVSILVLVGIVFAPMVIIIGLLFLILTVVILIFAKVGERDKENE